MTYIEILQQLIVKLEASGAIKESSKIKAVANTNYDTQTQWVGETALAALDLVRYNERLDKLIGDEVFDMKQYALSLGLVVS